MDNKLCRLKDFFANRCILITGGTGFIGMALIEALLTSSPDLRRIYVVVREKKGLKPAERIFKLLSSEIFDHLPPETKAKVVPILGDLTAENFGLEPSILAEIRGTVTVVYHNAGLIKFNRSLKDTVLMNVLSTLRCIELAKSLAKLSVFIYTSSVTANTNIQGKISEKVYKTKRSPKEMIMLALESPSTLDKVPEIKSDMIEGHVNSYTYSKQLAENLILEELSGFPAGIVRPALVYGFYEHKVPGWMGTSTAGQCGQIKGHVKGGVRSISGNPRTIQFSIPCDHVVNCMMALAVSLGTQEISPKLPVVAHLCNNRTVNPITMQDFVKILNEESWKNPCDTYFLLPRIKIRNGFRGIIYFIASYLAAIALVVPEKFINISTGKIKGINIVDMQYKLSSHIAELGNVIYDVDIDVFQNLNERLHPDDQKQYSFDISRVNWNKLIASSIAWLRKFYFKDSCSVTWMHRVVQLGYLAAEIAAYFSIFIGIVILFLVVGYFLDVAISSVLMIALPLAIGYTSFVVWI